MTAPSDDYRAGWEEACRAVIDAVLYSGLDYDTRKRVDGLVRAIPFAPLTEVCQAGCENGRIRKFRFTSGSTFNAEVTSDTECAACHGTGRVPLKTTPAIVPSAKPLPDAPGWWVLIRGDGLPGGVWLHGEDGKTFPKNPSDWGEATQPRGWYGPLPLGEKP